MEDVPVDTLRPMRRKASQRRVSYTDQDDLDEEIAEMEADEKERKQRRALVPAFLAQEEEVDPEIERVITHR